MKLFPLMLLCLVPPSVFGVDFGKFDVQVHGNFAQGGMLGSYNNYLTAPTSHGTLQWTDATLNAATDLTDRLRVGVQLHSYRLGDFGKFHPEIDWAYGEYRVADWLNLRGGKVKTRLGLFNDTQDVDALHLWSLLPQGVYPADNRSWFLAHTGGDIGGEIELPAGAGRMSWQGYLGRRVVDPNGGYLKLTEDEGYAVNGGSGMLYGGDVRWHTPVRGLTAGSSLGLAGVHVDAATRRIQIPFTIESTSDTNTALYGEFDRGNFYAAGEYRRRIWNLAIPEFQMTVAAMDMRSWYLMSSYRVHPKMQVGAYCSRFRYVKLQTSMMPFVFGGGETDWVAAARFDPNRHLYLKLEAHYMDGASMPQGFYPSTNPRLDRVTRLLLARIGLTF